MAFIFETVAEYDQEIALLVVAMRTGMNAEEFSLNTSQSNQRVVKNLKEMRTYLRELTNERAALAERKAGAGVVSIVPRRYYN